MVPFDLQMGRVRYAKKVIVVDSFFLLENFGAKQLGSSAYKRGSDRYRKVEET